MLKLGIEQVIKKLDKFNISFKNILDMVEEGNIPMYVYSAEWHYSSNGEDELSIYLSNEVSIGFENYQIYNTCIPQIRYAFLKGDYKNTLDELEIFVQPPGEDDRPEQYQELHQQLKETLLDEIERFIDDYPFSHENNWVAAYDIEDDESVELDESIDWTYYREHSDYEKYRNCESGQVKEIDGHPVHLDTYDNFYNLKDLFEEYKQNEFVQYDSESYTLISDNADSEEAIVSEIEPNFSEESYGINVQEIYFLENDINEFIDLLDNNNKNKQGKVHGNIEANTQKRLEVLGAAVYVLANFQDQCKNKQGKIEAAKISKLIEEKSFLIWKNVERDGKIPPLSTDAMSKIISNWLKLFEKSK